MNMSNNIRSFSVIDSIKEAWHQTKGAKATFWAVFVIFMVILIPLATPSYLLGPKQFPLLTGILSIIAQLVYLLLTMATLYLGIQRAFGKPIQFTMMGYVFSFNLLIKMIG